MGLCRKDGDLNIWAFSRHSTQSKVTICNIVSSITKVIGIFQGGFNENSDALWNLINDRFNSLREKYILLLRIKVS